MPQSHWEGTTSVVPQIAKTTPALAAEGYATISQIFNLTASLYNIPATSPPPNRGLQFRCAIQFTTRSHPRPLLRPPERNRWPSGTFHSTRRRHTNRIAFCHLLYRAYRSYKLSLFRRPLAQSRICSLEHAATIRRRGRFPPTSKRRLKHKNDRHSPARYLSPHARPRRHSRNRPARPRFG